MSAFRSGLKIERGHVELVISLADLLVELGRAPEAEMALRIALESNRRSAPIIVRLARALSASGRAEEALRLTARLAAEPSPDHAALAEHAAAFKTLGQQTKAMAVFERAASLFPDSPVAHHNLAAASGDLGDYPKAMRSAATALRKGGDAPQTWLVYARALAGTGALDNAERAYKEAIARDAFNADAHRDMAQLIWMRTEDIGAALSALDRAIESAPPSASLPLLRSNLLHHAGDNAAAYATLLEARSRYPDEISVTLAASQMAGLCGLHAEAMVHAEHAAAARPDDHAAKCGLFVACVATGQAERAGVIAEALVAADPLDQRALAYQATAWRLLGDRRYASLYDYEGLVRSWRIDTPDGWASLGAFLADLAGVLGRMHPYRTHPLDQSLRHGSQATHLAASADPVIRAFFRAIEGPISRHLAAIGPGADKLRRRATGTARIHGAWSVRLRPGGFHTDHIHPEGWISSACYIELPTMHETGREAWIKFGEPGIPTQPKLPPEHFVRPEPGLLVLFPSYMWHGTVPFSNDSPRLSIAFDLLPGSGR